MNLKTWSRHFWLLPAFCIIFGILPNIVSSETKVVCYYTSWSVYRSGSAEFTPLDIDPNLCTHLIYAFGNLTEENSLAPFDTYHDIKMGGFAKFTALKTYNKKLKTMFAISFSSMVVDPDRRTEMVKNSVKFLRQNHFDGLDLNWEYPSFRGGGEATDRDNYVSLVQELREEFDGDAEKTRRPRLLLTMAVPALIEYIDKGYDIPKLTQYLDWMNILSYDYYSTFKPAVNHHSPLYPVGEDDKYNNDRQLNINYTIQYYLKAGADPKQLVLGIPTFGKSYTLLNPGENGNLPYYEICENIKEKNWTVVQPNPNAMGPYAFKGSQWVSYDDELIIKKKSKYVVENGLGGVMFWSIDNDDFRGNCFKTPYPLIEAAKEALLTAESGKTDIKLCPAKFLGSESVTLTQRTSVGENSGGRQIIHDQPSSGSRQRIGQNNRTKVRSEETQTRPRDKTTGRRRQSTTSAPATTRTMFRTTSTTEEPEYDKKYKYEDEANLGSKRGSLTYSKVNRNRQLVPQNQGIEKQDTEDGSLKGQPQYTTIDRNRDQRKIPYTILVNINIL